MDIFLKNFFSEHQVKIFEHFEQWDTDNYHVLREDDWDRIEKYYADYAALRKQVLNGFVADVFFNSTDAELKMFQAKIDLEFARRSEERKKRKPNLFDLIDPNLDHEDWHWSNGLFDPDNLYNS